MYGVVIDDDDGDDDVVGRWIDMLLFIFTPPPNPFPPVPPLPPIPLLILPLEFSK